MYTKAELPPTPQAHSSRKEALKLGAELIERELLALRGRALQADRNGSPKCEAMAMDAMHFAGCAGRLREMAEAADDA